MPCLAPVSATRSTAAAPPTTSSTRWAEDQVRPTRSPAATPPPPAGGGGSAPAAASPRRDREAAVNFGEAARDAGVERVIYLGGLGAVGEDASEHLRSRHEVAGLLRRRVPELVYVRAA